MKIKYENNRLKFNLVYGSFMIIVGIIAIFHNSSSFFNYCWIIIGLLQVGTYFYDKKYQYLTIKNNTLIKHFLIPQKIKINEIKKVRKVKNTYKVETDKKTIRISKNLIEVDSLKELELFFDNLNLQV